jgi:fructan beta-fructosidase
LYHLKLIFQASLVALVLLAFSGCKSHSETNQIISRYQEKHRPQLHFSPDSMWMNDPNGMVFHEGEYHLFYQYFPDSTVWGPMHWGHAVSKDMVHWEHLPIALYPDSLGYIFSGCAVIDRDNTAGFGKDAMVAIYTYHNIDGEKSGRTDFQTQGIAYSLDKGRTFKKYNANPVIKNPGIKDFRDPKVIWHVDTKSWVMVFAAYDKVLFYTSPDLKTWTPSGEFGIKGDDRLWECPDLFPIKVEGTDEQKWILITSIQKKGPNGGTATSYFVGKFDGKTFIPDTDEQYWLDYGKDNYAFVTWSNTKEIVGIGWMSNWQYAQVVPTQKWRSAMTLPRSLKLIQNGKNYLLTSQPTQSLSTIHRKSTTISVTKDTVIQTEIPALCKIDLSFSKSSKGDKSFVRLSNSKNQYLDLGYNHKSNQYFIDRTYSGEKSFNSDFPGLHFGEILYQSDKILMSVYLDHASVELFADDGKCVMTDICFPSEPFTKLTIHHSGNLLSGSFTELSSIW